MRIFVLLIVCGWSLVAAEPLEIVWFELGDNGQERCVSVPDKVLQNLTVRGQWSPEAVKPMRMSWREALAPGKARLVGARVRFGTRLNVVGLMLDEDGVVVQAVRRPAATTFDVRLDRGQPGPSQGLENTYTEICADLSAGSAVAGEPVSVVVRKQASEGTGPSGGRLSTSDRYGLEALVMGVLTQQLGQRTTMNEGAARTVSVSALRRAVQVAVEVSDGTRSTSKGHLPQEHLYVYMTGLISKVVLPEGKRMTDFRLLNATWKTVDVVAEEPTRLALQTGEEAFWYLSLDDGGVTELAKPPVATGLLTGRSSLRLVSAQGEEVWAVSFDSHVGGGLATIGGVVHVFTDDGMMHLLEASSGKEKGRLEVGRRVRGAAAAQLGEVLWVTDFDGNLLGLDATSGKVVSETALGEVLLAPVAVFGDGLLAVTKGRTSFLLDRAGKVTGTHVFPASVMCHAEAGGNRYLADRTGAVWEWRSGAAKPELLLAWPGQVVSMHYLKSFPEQWKLASAAEKDDLMDLELTDSSPHLLLLTGEGMGISVLVK